MAFSLGHSLEDSKQGGPLRWGLSSICDKFVRMKDMHGANVSQSWYWAMD